MEEFKVVHVMKSMDGSKKKAMSDVQMKRKQRLIKKGEWKSVLILNNMRACAHGPRNGGKITRRRSCPFINK